MSDATADRRDYTYDEWRAINEAFSDAMEYAHDHAILYPDKADPLWNMDEYVNRVIEIAYGNKSREPKVVAEWRSVALGLFDSLEKADLEAAQRWLCENDLLRQEIAYGDAKAATVGRSCSSCPEMDNPDSYISHLQSALKWHDEHVPRPTNPRSTCVVLEGEKPPEEVLFIGANGVTHYLPEGAGTCKDIGDGTFVCSECGSPT